MPSEPNKLLIVDDEKDICEILKTKFEKSGFNISLAFDGLEAYQKTLALQPHCILLDIRMPREDGLSFLRKIRSFRHEDLDFESKIRKIPIVVLTGAGDQMKPLFQLEGIADYLEKPFDFEILKERVLKVLNPA